MIAPLLAGALLIAQNPQPARVRHPADWKVEYGQKTQDGGGAVIGPNGQEISFPAYGSSGNIARSLSELDRKRALKMFVLGGREIDIMLTKEALLVVSYPPDFTPGKLSSFPVTTPIDYWSKVKTPKEVAQTLAITLTRVEVATEEARKNREGYVPAPLPPTNPAMPFPGIQARNLPYVNDPKNFTGPAFDGKYGPEIELRAEITSSPKWTVRERLIDGTLTLLETTDGKFAATYQLFGDKTYPPQMATFVAKRATKENVIDAAIAAITYRKPQP